MSARLMLLVALCCALMSVETKFTAAQPAQTGTLYYVSRNGSNTDGRTWETAWIELDQIAWEQIAPGDTIFIDGGDTAMTYETSLAIGQSGETGKPITLQASAENGHNGQVILFGGRAELLPYCGQETYTDLPKEAMRSYGIRTHDHDYIVIDGGRWRGMVVHGFRNGIRIDSDSTNVTLRYLEVYNNGTALKEEEGWAPDQCGVCIGGIDITLQRMIIHDNGQDAIQSLSGENNIANFRLEQSWLYNGRQHPTEANKAANYCSHADGIQIFDGGVVSGITVSESVIGPGLSNGVILGQLPTKRGSWANVQDVVLRDVLFMKASDNNIYGYRNTDTHNWVLERVTAHCPYESTSCLRLLNPDHVVVDSIIIGGHILFPDGLNTYAGNCIWNTTGFELGEHILPDFASVSNTDFFSLDDYSVPPDSQCHGSRIASVEDLFALE